jgi:hypothetical protein
MKLELFSAIFAVFITVTYASNLPIQRYDGRINSCPYGYLSSGGYCVPTEGAQPAIPYDSRHNCPWGWASSGNACLKSGDTKR